MPPFKLADSLKKVQSRRKLYIAITSAITATFASQAFATSDIGKLVTDSETINGDLNLAFPKGEYPNEGLLFQPNKQDQTLIFKVSGKTTISVETTSTTSYGIRIPSSKALNNHSEAEFNDLTIRAVADGQDKQRTAIGIWTYGGYDSSPGAPNNPGPASSITVKGPLEVYAEGSYKAHGIASGSDYSGNSYGNGKIFLLGDVNNITVVLNAVTNVDSIAKSTGILAYDGGLVDASGQTNIKVITNLGGNKINHVNAGVVSDGEHLKSSVTLGNTTIVIQNNSNFTNSIYGVETGLFASYYADKDQSTTTLNGKTKIILSSNKNSHAYGLASFGSSITANDLVTIQLDNSQENIGGFAEFNAIHAGLGFGKFDNSSIDLKNGLVVKLPENVRPGDRNIHAINAVNGALEDLNGSTAISLDSGRNVVQIEGNLFAEKSGNINLTMKGENSFLTGWADNSASSSAGSIDLKIGDGASWNVISKVDTSSFDGKNSVNSLDLSGGTLDMTYATVHQKLDWEGSDHRQHLIITNGTGQAGLSGSGGTIKMDIDLAGETKNALLLDQIEVKGKAEGEFTGLVNFVNGLDGVSAEKLHSENWLISQQSGVMTMTGKSAANGSMQSWSLKFFKNEADLDDISKGASTSDGGAGWWYLVRNEESDLPPEPNQNINVGTSTGQALAWAAELEDLRLRLGEVRYGAQDGAWVKASFTKDRAYGSGRHGFKQETNALHVGFDRLVGTSESSSWLLGASFRYGHSEQDGFAEANGGSGELEQYSVKAYTTWMHESGTYLDLVAQTGWYEQSLEGVANDGKTSYSASYNTRGSGASIEVGRMFTLYQDPAADDRLWWSHWFVEPQAQLSYFRVQGEDYTTSTGLKVSQESADFLTGRLGAVLGKKVSYGGLDDLEKRYFQAAVMGGVKYEFKGDQGINFTGSDNVRLHVDAADMGGVRWYYGFMLDWQLSESLRLYGQVSREEGSHYTREYDVHFGAKYQF